MENTGLQYENSLTRQAEEAMDMWTKELADTGLFSGASGWCFRRNRGIL